MGASSTHIAMSTVLIVHAHPEPKSFSSALAQTAADTFTRAGHHVEVSDLYAMAFDPVSNRSNYVSVADPHYFKPQREELHATEHRGFAPALDAEIRKLEACDLLVFSFPLWWFGLPAILKGWVDRVFAYKRIYGDGRWYDQGIGRGKRALVLMTTGSPASAFRSGGLHTPLESILAPVHHGIFWFNGFAPLRPFVTWAAAHISEDDRKRELHALQARLATVWHAPVSLPPSVAEYETGTWADRTPRFLVMAHAEGNLPAAVDLPSPRDRDMLRQFRQTRQVTRALLGTSSGGVWQASFEVRSASPEEALERIRSLPLAAHCTLRCARLDDRTADDLSP